MFGNTGDKVVNERKVGLTQFLTDYVAPRAHTSVVSEFLDIRTRASYSSVVSEIVRDGDGCSITMSTELQFQPSQAGEVGDELSSKADADGASGEANMPITETWVVNKEYTEIVALKNRLEESAGVTIAYFPGKLDGNEAFDNFLSDVLLKQLHTPGVPEFLGLNRPPTSEPTTNTTQPE